MSPSVRILNLLAHTPAGKRKCFSMIFHREDQLPVRPPEPKEDDPRYPMYMLREEERAVGLRQLESRETEQLTLRNAHGDLLRATLVLKDPSLRSFAVLSHGYRNHGLREFAAFLPWYLEKPVNLLIVDHQAHGESEGKIITFGAREHADLIAWLNVLTERFGSDIRIMLHGISMGAATVMLAAGSPELPSQVRTVLADCGYTSLEEEITYCLTFFGASASLWKDLARRFEKETGADPASVNTLEAVRRAKVPVRLIHGANDTFVPTRMSEKIRDEIPGTELTLIDGADHAESWTRDPEAYKKLLDRCLADIV